MFQDGLQKVTISAKTLSVSTKESSMAQTQMSANLKLINAVFAAMLVGIVGYFIYWGLGYTHYTNSVLFIIATMFGVFMAFNVGGNDIANSFGTSVGSGTLTIPQALLIAAVFEVSGAVIAGGEVTDTIRKGIVNLNGMNLEPMQFVFIMMSALLAAALWLLFASRKGLPVSTTHAIIGGIVGSALCMAFTHNADGVALIRWGKLGEIGMSWVLSPVLGGAVSYFLFSRVKKNVLDYNAWAEGTLKGIKQEKRRIKNSTACFSRVCPKRKKSNMPPKWRTTRKFTTSLNLIRKSYNRSITAVFMRSITVKTMSILTRRCIPGFPLSLRSAR
ncbi:phosphate transporter family protein [Neisseria polysaccharea ATCC 43768]|nr:phosphate transporter family protein [Neisseria polysaccharea ATCC 43768]